MDLIKITLFSVEKSRSQFTLEIGMLRQPVYLIQGRADPTHQFVPQACP